MDAQDLVWTIYASLYSNHAMDAHQKERFEALLGMEWKNKTQMVDGLMYLRTRLDVPPREQLQQLAMEDRIPHVNPNDLTKHLKVMYQEVNPTLNATILHSKQALSFMYFADQLDGQLDRQINIPDIEGFYHFFIELDVPLAALGFNFRDRQKWYDRRSVIRLAQLEKELPHSIRKLKRMPMKDADKLDKVIRFVTSRVVPQSDGESTDYWQTPFETLLLGEGDCEDFAILLHATATLVGVKTQIIIGHYIKTGPKGKLIRTGHAWVEYKNRVIDPLVINQADCRYDGQVRFDARHAQFVTRPK